MSSTASPIGISKQEGDHPAADVLAAQLSAIVASSEDAIIGKDLSGTVTSWNHGAEKIFGFSAAEMIGESIRRLIPPDRQQEEISILERVGRGERIEHCETQRRTKAGRLIDVSVAVSPIKDATGRIVGASKIARDISERKQVMAALQDNEELFSSAFRLSPDGVAIVRLSDGTVLRANDAICEIWGCTPGEIIGKPTRDFSSWVNEAERLNFMAQIERTGECLDYETTLRLADGRHVPFNVSSRIMLFSGERCTLSILRDLTERERTAAALQESEARLRGTLDRVLEGCQIIGRDWRYIYLNDPAARHGRRLKAELIGRTVMESYPGFEATPVFALMRRCMEDGTTARVDSEFVYPDGTTAWFELSIQPEPEGIAVLSVDITERKRVAEQIRQLNADLERRVALRTAELQAANDELEAFSCTVSHDLRAPLRAISGFSQAVIEDHGERLPEEGKRHLQTIRRAATKMNALIDDLLKFSRYSRQALASRAVPTEAMVRTILQESFGVVIESGVMVKIEPLPESKGDPALLRQVWLNLLSNAFKYSRDRQPAVVEIGSCVTEGETVFYVRDNGAGFDQSKAPGLFGVFQRFHREEEYEGTGVGLAIVRRIVQRHGGRVWADAAVDRGATFYFTLGRSFRPPPVLG